ncbi:hypothetical protein [Rubripirellula lacrimiformis]|nr:hypothetical protein [Rubripirellula lacrimiformis]
MKTISKTNHSATFIGRSSLVLAAMVCTWTVSDRVWAYTPNDAVVQQMVNRGVSYLEALPPEADKLGIDGTVPLIAYAHHKCRHDPDHPLVKRGIAWAIRYLKQYENPEFHSHKGNYEMSVCVLLLADVDPVLYRPQLEALQKALMHGQFPNGPFGYPGESIGDVSQTQYAILAIWTLDRVGIPMDYAKVVACLQWLLRVQDLGGAWPYKGTDPGPGKPNIQQTQRVGISMGLAGGSSILIAGDALRLWGETGSDENDPGIVGLPKAIKLYLEDGNANRRKKVKLSDEPIRRSIGFLENWRGKNPYKRGGLDFYYYILYTQERYESFVEISRGAEKDLSPDWYNRGVDELRGYQSPSGGWEDRSQTTAPVSTAFALLFLIRSTQKTIFSTSSGTLEGGYGLPKDTTNIRVDGTQIKGQAVATQVTDLLKILESDGAGDTEGKSLPDDLQLDPTPDGRRAQLDRLERLVRGSRSWQARRVAAKLLGKSDELRVVPALIFALSDPDKVARQYARDGLRFISRKFEGFGMPDEPSDAEVDQAQEQWRDWYRTVDPTYVFLDYDL